MEFLVKSVRKFGEIFLDICTDEAGSSGFVDMCSREGFEIFWAVRGVCEGLIATDISENTVISGKSWEKKWSSE